VDYNGLPPVLSNWTTSGPGMNASSSVLMDVWEVPLYSEMWFTTRTRAFFRAPVTGPHTFSVVADDFAQLTASWLQVSCPLVRRSGGVGCAVLVPARGDLQLLCRGPHPSAYPVAPICLPVLEHSRSMLPFRQRACNLGMYLMLLWHRAVCWSAGSW
jgi:hypothetical protein